MKRRALFGILALVPAAFNVAPAGAHSITVALCTGDGVARTMTVPVPGRTGPPGREEPGCCTKACHTGSRKKSHCRQIDT